jgi:GT2 family glycosyltransferase
VQRVTAVIVNWNGRAETLACLRALAHSRPPPAHVIVVDNGSTDGSAEAIAASYPEVELLVLPRNRHFAAGANAGMRAALAGSADGVWLLNNDVRVTPGALGELLQVLEAYPRAGIAGARLVHPGLPGEIIGADCDLRTGAIRDRPAPDDPAVAAVPVDYVWGCAMLIRAAVLAEIGVFDESLVAYFEDTDLCLRARRAGWRTLGAVRAVVHHDGSASAGRRFLYTQYLRGRNWARCFLRHAPPGERGRLRLWLLGVRLPGLAWATLLTVVARGLRRVRRVTGLRPAR